MGPGLELDGVVEDVGSSGCPLTMCLLACLFDAQALSSRSIPSLRSALLHLDHRIEPGDRNPAAYGPHPRALAACLEYILPEVILRSGEAGRHLSRSIAILMEEGPAAALREPSGHEILRH